MLARHLIWKRGSNLRIFLAVAKLVLGVQVASGQKKAPDAIAESQIALLSLRSVNTCKLFHRTSVVLAGQAPRSALAPRSGQLARSPPDSPCLPQKLGSHFLLDRRRGRTLLQDAWRRPYRSKPPLIHPILRRSCEAAVWSDRLMAESLPQSIPAAENSKFMSIVTTSIELARICDICAALCEGTTCRTCKLARALLRRPEPKFRCVRTLTWTNSDLEAEILTNLFTAPGLRM
eukprot:s2403_g12.t1